MTKGDFRMLGGVWGKWSETFNSGVGAVPCIRGRFLAGARWDRTTGDKGPPLRALVAERRLEWWGNYYFVT
jgi:hypothetical protein